VHDPDQHLDPRPSWRAAAVSRRRALLGGAAVVAAPSFVAVAGRFATPAGALASASATCVVAPDVTQGPYWIDTGLERSDIRADGDGTDLQAGVLLTLTIDVLNVDACTAGGTGALSGAQVDIWHANATGMYSGVTGQGDSRNVDTRANTWLRGYQVTGSDGRVTFTTVYPGWYSGRTPHIHLRVRVGGTSYSVTQLFFAESVNAAVYATSAYARSRTRDTSNAADSIYGEEEDEGNVLLVPLTGSAAAGYAGAITVGVAGLGAGTTTTTTTTTATTSAVGLAVTPSGAGYWLADAAGRVRALGDAVAAGDLTGTALNRPVVGITAAPTGSGYWLVASDGGVFAFGDATFHGSTGAIALNRPIVGLSALPSGVGYRFVASDGGVFAYDAAFHGSTGAIALNRPIVGMATTPSGAGYWLVASDGGVFAFGDAVFRGSTGAIALNRPIVGMATTPSGAGYWLVASDGGVFAFGDAVFRGSTGGAALAQPVVGAASTPSGAGYWLVAADGGVFAFGDAESFGTWT
jgi:protocatechuate 3,4-dioxygenase beta subunit